MTAGFDAEPGETVAVLGPNGSGKSTLVACLAGLLPPDSGSIALGREILDDTSRGVHVPPERRRVGVVFQELLLFPHLTALGNVAFPLRARGVPRGEAAVRAERLLERLHVAEPELLLLDEPLSALDAGARPVLREVLREELERFAGVRILITHDPVEASTLADRLVLLEAGHVTQVGTPEQVRAAPRSRYAADLVGVNAFRGPLVPLDEGAGRISTGGGEVVVPWPRGFGGGEAIGILRPVDVTISLERPSGSARNVFRGPVTSVAPEGDRARVRLGTAPLLVAEVTLGSVDRLGLRPGVEVWASFKAVEVEVLPS